MGVSGIDTLSHVSIVDIVGAWDQQSNALESGLVVERYSQRLLLREKIKQATNCNGSTNNRRSCQDHGSTYGEGE
jgi:hypothetical protein